MHLGLHQFLVLPACGFEHEEQVVFYGAVGEQLIVLEDNAQPAAEVRQFAASDLRHVLSEYHCRAARDGERTIDGLEQAGLAATHLTEQVDEFAIAHLQIHVLEHDMLGLMNLDIYVL